MEVIPEQVVVYGVALLLCATVIYIYWRKHRKQSEQTMRKVAIAKEEGLFEPVSLHPYIDLNRCMGSAACVAACPEKDILGIVDGKATVINASNCVGHGACFHACPVEAISLRIGTESRGVDLPHVSEDFETNVSGIYIAGELGGMGLIKNSVEQGQQAVDSVVKKKRPAKENVLDLVVVGAGPAGISASLQAKKRGLKCVTLEQDSLGGTVFTFPREKIVMTSPMDLPLYGKTKLYDTSKDELLKLWNEVIAKNNLQITENTKVENIIPQADNTFKIETNTAKTLNTHNIILAIGRRGSPRKLGIPGENLPNVAYRLLEPGRISSKKIIVAGGGDSAVESALLLKDNNEVILSYRSDKFARIKPKNKENVQKAIDDKSLTVLFNSNLVSISDKSVEINVNGQNRQMENDLVYIFAGGELPAAFLQKAGIQITKKFGHIVKKHN